MSQSRLDEKERKEPVFCLRPSTFRPQFIYTLPLRGEIKVHQQKPVALEMSVSCVQGPFRHRTKYTL